MRDVKSYGKRLEKLRSERASFIPYYKELSDEILAHRGRFLTGDRNKGHKRNTKQLNNTARMSARTLASGMMTGITSPSRPWFRLAAPTPELNEVGAVKTWLHDVEVAMREVFNRSNVYNALHTTYSELGTFSVAALGVFEDFENVIWCRPYTVGSYMLAMNGKNVVDTLYREYEITVSQLVDEFGIDNASERVKTAYEKGNSEQWIKIVHVVEPNDGRDSLNPMAKHKKFRSVYYEHNITKADKNQFLRESGFDTFPILAPRWDATGEDVYGTDGPGMTALGDIKALQLMERRMAQAIDKVVSPPMQAPASMKNKISSADLRAGELSFVPDTSAGGIKSIYDFRPDLNAIGQRIEITEDRIEKSFYVDLFLMLANDSRRQPVTAREISERHEEKLLMLGPVLERLHTELLDPLIDRTFSIMQKAGILPEPPEELRDTEIQVEYISVLAQAQRLVAVGGIERTAGFIGQISQIFPDARHKFDAEQAVDEFAAAVGVSPKLIRSDEDVAEIKRAEQAAIQQQQAAEQAAQMTDMAAQASQIDTQGQNALTDMMDAAGAGQ